MAASRYRFDMLARAVEGVQERTVCGALVTVGSVMIIAFLVLFEVKEFLTVSKVHHIGVDDGIKPFGRDRWTVPDQIPVELKMTFAHIECDRLSLEIDATRGDVDPVNQVNFRQPTRKELEDFPLATPETACTLDGHLTVGKVSANFYVQISDQADGPTNKKMLPLALQAYANQMISLERRKFVNISHRVHALHFGERVKDTASPLDGVVNAPTVAGQQHYLIKVIPTLVDRAFGHVATNQYSLAEQFVRYDTIVFMPYVRSFLL